MRYPLSSVLAGVRLRLPALSMLVLSSSPVIAVVVVFLSSALGTARDITAIMVELSREDAAVVAATPRFRTPVVILRPVRDTRSSADRSDGAPFIAAHDSTTCLADRFWHGVESNPVDCRFLPAASSPPPLSLCLEPDERGSAEQPGSTGGSRSLGQTA
jgi:hypothetical protein